MTIQLNENHMEILRTIAAQTDHEYSGKWVTEGNLAHLGLSGVRAMEMTGLLTSKKDGEGCRYYRMTVRGWGERRSLPCGELEAPSVCRGDRFATDKEVFVVEGTIAGG